MDNVLLYIQSKNWVYTSINDQYQTVCPFCVKPDHFYINKDNGLWKCHHCQRAGSLSTLKKDLGDDDGILTLSMLIPPAAKPKVNLTWDDYQQSINNLWEDEAALKYLNSRGLNADTITHFKLGLKKQKKSVRNGNAYIDWISIPVVSQLDLVNIKYRSIPPYEKDFGNVSGCPLLLFNTQEFINKKPDYLILCEGEFDAMILWQNGFTNVLSTTGGASTFKPEWFTYIQSINPSIIYLLYDTDAPGQAGAKMLQDRLGEVCRNVLLPRGKDATDFFVKEGGTTEELQKLLNTVAMSDISGVVSASYALDELLTELKAEEAGELHYIKTPWENLNRLLSNRFKPGDLITLSARSKIGKTSLALHLAYDVAHHQKKPVLFMCLEMRPQELVRKMLGLSLNKDYNHLSVNDFMAKRDEVSSLPFYFAHFYEHITTEKVEKVFTAAKKRYGVELIVFDNINFLARSITNLAQEIGMISKKFKMMAEHLKVPILLIAQPRRTDSDVISSEDLRDSSSIKMDSDAVIILHRQEMVSAPPSDNLRHAKGKLLANQIDDLEAAFHPITLVKVDASRYSAGGSCFLYYEGSKNKFRIPTQEEMDSFKELYFKKKEEKKYKGGKYDACGF